MQPLVGLEDSCVLKLPLANIAHVRRLRDDSTFRRTVRLRRPTDVRVRVSGNFRFVGVRQSVRLQPVETHEPLLTDFTEERQIVHMDLHVLPPVTLAPKPLSAEITHKRALPVFVGVPFHVGLKAARAGETLVADHASETGSGHVGSRLRQRRSPDVGVFGGVRGHVPIAQAPHYEHLVADRAVEGDQGPRVGAQMMSVLRVADATLSALAARQSAASSVVQQHVIESRKSLPANLATSPTRLYIS